MKLRTEMRTWSDGKTYPSFHGEREVYTALEHDAMAAHALMRVMGAYAEYFGSHIKRIQSDADELMREWTGGVG